MKRVEVYWPTAAMRQPSASFRSATEDRLRLLDLLALNFEGHCGGHNNVRAISSRIVM